MNNEILKNIDSRKPRFSEVAIAYVENFKQFLSSERAGTDDPGLNARRICEQYHAVHLEFRKHAERSAYEMFSGYEGEATELNLYIAAVSLNNLLAEKYDEFQGLLKRHKDYASIRLLI